MAQAVSDRLWTVSEVEAWAQIPPFEIVEGVLYVTAMPAFPHGDIVTNLLLILQNFVKTHGLGKVYAPQTGIYYSETNYLDPDLIFLRKSQRPRKGSRNRTAALAVEVLSASDGRAPRSERESLFHKAGVEELWYIDYAARSMEQCRRTDLGYALVRTYGEHDLVRSELIPGLELTLEAAWEDVEE